MLSSFTHLTAGAAAPATAVPASQPITIASQTAPHQHPHPHAQQQHPAPFFPNIPQPIASLSTANTTINLSTTPPSPMAVTPLAAPPRPTFESVAQRISVKESLRELKEFIQYVESRPSLLALPDSSFVNDYLRTFTIMRQVQYPAYADLNERFMKLPDDAQFQIIRFLNASSLLSLARVSRQWYEYLTNEGFLDSVRKYFPHYLQAGDRIDALDSEGKWYEATVLQVSSTQLYIHYEGWSSRWDAWIDKDSDMLAPLRTRSKHTAARRPLGSGIIFLIGGPAM